MRLRKLFIITAALLAVPAAALAADNYTPVTSASLALSQTTAARGSTMTATANPGSTDAQEFNGAVSWFVNSTRVQVGSSNANSAGGASLTFVVPSTLESGAHTIEATGTSAAGTTLTVTRAFTVSGGTALARTGAPSNTDDMVRVGGALIVVGAVLVFGVARRRRTAQI